MLHCSLVSKTFSKFRSKLCILDLTILMNPFTPDSAKPKIDKQYSKVLLNSFSMNGHIIGLEKL